MIKKLIKALRINEVSLMTGFFVIGGFFAIDSFSTDIIIKLTWLGILSFSIVLSVYSFNAAAGIRDDVDNYRLQNLWGLQRKYFMLFSMLFFLLSIFLSFLLNKYIPVFSGIIILLWVLYSHPVFGLKRKAIWGTLIHFFGQILHFNMAYLAFKDVSVESVMISIFFAVAFSSGHLLHEIIDYDADKKSGLQTSAVKFGINAMGTSVIILLLINVILLIGLFAVDFISMAFYCFMIPALIHLLLFVVFKKKVQSKALFIRSVYRVVYFTGGLIFCGIKLYSYLT